MPLDANAKMEDILKKHKDKIPTLIIIVLALFIAHKVYKTQASAVVSLQAKIVEETKKNEKFEHIVQMEEKLDQFKKLLVRTETELSMNNISNLARDSGVQLQSIRPEGEQQQQYCVRYPFSISVIAPDYNTLGKFISKLENFKDVYMVDSVNVSPSGGKNKQVKAEIKLNSVAFRDTSVTVSTSGPSRPRRSK